MQSGVGTKNIKLVNIPGGYNFSSIGVDQDSDDDYELDIESDDNNTSDYGDIDYISESTDTASESGDIINDKNRDVIQLFKKRKKQHTSCDIQDELQVETDFLED